MGAFTRTAKTPGVKKSKGGGFRPLGIDIGSIPREYGRIYAFPVRHPIETGKAITREVMKVPKLFGGEPGQPGVINPEISGPIVRQVVQRGKYRKLPEAESAKWSKEYRGAIEQIPFVGSTLAHYGAALGDPHEAGREARAHIKAHPAETLADANAFLSPLKGTKLEPLTTPLRTVTKAVAPRVGKAALKYAPEIATKVAEKASKVQAILPSKKGGVTGEIIGPARRQLEKEADVAPRQMALADAPSISEATPDLSRAASREVRQAALEAGTNPENLRRQVLSQTAPLVYKATGGMDWDTAMRNYTDMGLNPAQAERMIQARKLSWGADGVIRKPRPGDQLVDRTVGQFADAYFGGTREVSGRLAKASKKPSTFMQAWLVPTLWLAPRFHLGNIIGGAQLAALETSPIALIRRLPEARRMVKSGKLPTAIPVGHGQLPGEFIFDKAQAVSNGAKMVGFLQKTGHSFNRVVEFSKRMNENFDAMYRSVVYLDRRNKLLKKGKSAAEAEKLAVKAASDLLTNVDNFSPVERLVLQRIMPFWGWRRTMLKYLKDFPKNHPIKTMILSDITRDARLAQDESGLPDEFDSSIPLPWTTKDGKRLFLRARNISPFSDWDDLWSWRGFLNALHPIQQDLLKTVGYDPVIGGVPQQLPWEVDPYTGRRRLKLQPGKAFEGTFGWLGAAMQAAHITKGYARPKDDSLEGWVAWYREYGSRLGMPSLAVKDVEAERQKYLSNLEAQASEEERRAAQEEGEVTPVQSGTRRGAFSSTARSR